MKIKILKVDQTIKTPAYETPGAAGFDLRARLDRPVTLGPGHHYTIPTGLKFEIPQGFELQVRPRSGLAFKHMVMTSFGTVDSDYRGEVMINLMNHGRRDITIQNGERIAQGVVAPVIRAEFDEVTELSPTERGARGFGSTGSK